ncbi:alpha/beta hydrolase [Sinimarinibacterium flocculans]|uniref:Acetyl esterase/lipase n=1 Tax=Sinimarinibacterium flocculans TaxID=985250 RepID=A0A318E169_9GAMM|nr:alpha/beta hydrolase [Sinimarinibacterium flocculans]PXV64246.1 acetyl esterase/lipase [Sinimarinibacterium flocculans]
MKTRRLPAVLLIGATAWLASACGSRHIDKPDTPPPPPVQATYTIARDIRFTPDDWPQPLLADLYRPDGPGPHPSVLLIHGGAWKRGDREQVEGLAERIAERGYLVVNTTYRLVPAYIYPAQLQDIQQALRWMRTDGRHHGIDPQRIGAFGYSAGGHLAALAGHVANDPRLGDPQTRVQAIVAGGTPADLTLYEGGKLVPAFLGGSREQIPERFREASPAFHVDAADPPVFIYQATLDYLVPLAQAERYKSALDEAGVVNELFLIRGHGHISGFFADGAAVEAALAFLDRHLR